MVDTLAPPSAPLPTELMFLIVLTCATHVFNMPSVASKTNHGKGEIPTHLYILASPPFTAFLIPDALNKTNTPHPPSPLASILAPHHPRSRNKPPKQSPTQYSQSRDPSLVVNSPLDLNRSYGLPAEDETDTEPEFRNQIYTSANSGGFRNHSERG